MFNSSISSGRELDNLSLSLIYSVYCKDSVSFSDLLDDYYSFCDYILEDDFYFRDSDYAFSSIFYKTYS